MNRTHPVGGVETRVGSNRNRQTLKQRLSAFLLGLSICTCGIAQTPTLVQHISSGRDNTQGYSNPTFKFVLPNPTLTGNCLILRFDHDGAITTGSVKTDKGDTLAAGPSITTNGHVLQTYYVAASAASQVITITTSGSVGSNTDAASGDLSEFYNTSCVVDASGSSSSRSVTLNPTVANDLIWQSGDDTTHDVISQSGSGNYSGGPSITSVAPGSGYTMLQANISEGTFAQYRATAATGSQSVSFQSSDSDTWQSAAIAFKSAATGTAPPTSGIRVVNIYGEVFGNATHTMYVPCSGNLLVGMWSSPAVTISSISSNAAGAWSQGASISNGGALYAQIFYGQAMNCSSTLTITPTYSGASSGGLNFLIVMDVAGASSSPHDVDVTKQGDQTSGSTLATGTLTPSTANGLIVGSTAYWGCTAISASPGVFAGVATNSQNSDVCSPTNTTNSTLNEDNGLAFYYNPTTAPVTFTYTNTGPVSPWAAVTSAFKAASGTTQGLNPPSSMGSVTQ